MSEWSPPGVAPGSAEPLTRVREFLETAETAHTHVAKQILLTNFIHDIFGVSIVDLLPGIEKKVGSRVLGVRGSIDQLFRAAVIEIKTDFDRELTEAKGELRKYFQALIEDSPSQRYVGLVTDLDSFQAFRPVVVAGAVKEVKAASARIRARELPPEEFVVWVDGVIFSAAGQRPTAEALSRKFGPASPAYQESVETLSSLWAEVSELKSSRLKIRLWSRAMEIVYGAAPDPTAFVADTYLSILVRLLVFLRLDPTQSLDKSLVREAIDGSYFTNRGISNLIEEDFFAWILDEPVAQRVVDLCQSLATTLRGFDLSTADEDLFKEVYQEVVALGSRHAAGEYYTPRWLCELTIDRALRAREQAKAELPTILDPACGSGSFLTAAIHSYRARQGRKDDRSLLASILKGVQGIDINPLAVTIARANYLIALGELLGTGNEISIPVYVSDSIRLPELRRTVYHGLAAYDLEADEAHILVPARIVREASLRAKVFSLLAEAVEGYAADALVGETQGRGHIASFEREVSQEVSQAEVPVLVQSLEAIAKLVDDDRDSIWPFVIRNFYAPVMLRETKFDLVVGNPPWIVMRSIPDVRYQEFLKSSVQEYGLADLKERELLTHLEMATLFFDKTADLYLKDHGIISFVMPLSVTGGARHHVSFNRFVKPKMALIRVDSFEGVPGIFSLPPVVLTAEKGRSSKFPVPREKWSGSLLGVRRNASLADVLPSLKPLTEAYTPPVAPAGGSWYLDFFKAGAAIYPRPLWYVEGVVESTLGISARRPLLRSSHEAERVGKAEWREFKISGRVEADFIYASYLGKDILPFGVMPARPVVLPLRPTSKSIRLLTEEELRAEGYPLMARWVQKAQAIWVSNRTEKSIKNYPHVYDRLDHEGLLTKQRPGVRYVVIYNARGADACSVVVDRKALPALDLGELMISPAGFVAECTNYFYESDSADEAYYLSAVLNAPSVSLAVKPFQPRGLYGARDLGPRPLQLRLARFDHSKPSHAQLSALGRECHELASSYVYTKPGFRSRRELLHLHLKTQIAEIDALVKRDGMNQRAEDFAEGRLAASRTRPGSGARAPPVAVRATRLLS